MAKKKVSSDVLITVSAELPLFDHEGKRTKTAEHIALLDGFYDPDPMSQYIHAAELNDVKLAGGIVRCQVDGKKLLFVTDFEAAKKLNNKQLTALKSEVRGQWSDGIGEGAFDTFCEVTGCSVETYVRTVKATQTTGKSFKADSKAKTQLKKLNTAWKKAAKQAAPKNEMKVLVQCFEAVAGGKPAALKKLLASGRVDVNALCTARTTRFDEFRLLVFAARHANASIVGMLLDAGADPKLQDEFSFGYAPLHRAQHPSIVKKLLDAGANPNVHTRTFKETPLMMTEVVAHHESVKLLLAAGAKPKAKSEITRKSPLLAAVEVNPKSVAMLLKADAKPTLEALENAINPDSLYGGTNLKQQTEIAKLLMNSGVKPKPSTLLEAVGQENEELVRYLIAKEIPLKPIGKRKSPITGRNNPLNRAIHYRKTKMIKLLLALGADPNLGKGAELPLAVAIKRGSLQYVKMLVAAGAKLDPVEPGKPLEQTAKGYKEKEIAGYFAKLKDNSSSAKKSPASSTKKKKSAVKKKTAANVVGRKTIQQKTAKKKTAAKPARKKSGKPRRFELSDGKSNKFWEISATGSSLTTSFGRIGTDGQSKTKQFASDDKCQVEVEKLIRQKTGKGYEEI